jgi:opacity protein-like surface antigen
MIRSLSQGDHFTVETKIPIAVGLLAAWLSIAAFGMAGSASAETYVAGTVGVNFADQMTGISGTGDLSGSQAADFDLKNSISYGAKLGYFPDHRWFGIEGEVLQTSPHIKSLGSDPGIHLNVTTIGVNLLARYPGRTFQPYAGVGAATVIARLSDSPANEIQSDTSVTGGWNVLAGLRGFVTPHVAVFTEYKYSGATLRFDQAAGTGGFDGVYRAQQLLFGISYHF